MHNFKPLINQVKIFRPAFLLTLANFVPAVFSMFTVYIFANHFDPDSYGTYKYVMSIFGLLSVASLQGINTAVVQSVSRGFDDAVLHGQKKKFLYGTLGTIIGFGIALYYFYQGNMTLAICIGGAALLMPLINSHNVYRSFLNGKKEFRQLAFDTILFNTALLLSFLLVIYFTKNIVSVTLTYLSTTAIVNYLLFLHTTKNVSLSKDRSSDDQMLHFGKHLTFMKVISTSSGYIQGIALWHILGAKALPIFALAMAPTETVRPMLKIFEQILLPKFSEDDWNHKGFFWFYKKMFPLVLLMIVISVVFWLLSPYIYNLLFPKYLESVNYAKILFLTLIITPINAVLNTIMTAKKMVKELHIKTYCVTIFELSILLLIFKYGLYGLVFGIFVSKLLILILNSYLVFTLDKNHKSC